MLSRTLPILVLMAGLLTQPAVVIAGNNWAGSNWDGSIELEHRLFWDDQPEVPQSSGQTSGRVLMEFFYDWNNNRDVLTFEPFFRYDKLDNERTHFDIRQLVWSHLGENWDISVGIDRVFWGVTESKHLVDIINQTDSVENIDGEDKLGQPVLHYQYFHDLGTVEAFLLPYFRTRTFSGPENRLNGGVIISNDHELYESGAEEKHLDLALRYSHTVGDWSTGLSWFRGTSREPDLQRFFNPQRFSTTPYYPQINQFGADIQLTTGGWLLKLEAIHRSFDDPLYADFTATTLGVEYTFTGVVNTGYDLGLLAEYSWDKRDKAATNPLQNDVFFGARLALNNMSSSEILLGIVADLDEASSHAVFIEASTRIAGTLTANIELRHFDSDNQRDLLFGLRDDSFIQVGLEYFFD